MKNRPTLPGHLLKLKKDLKKKKKLHAPLPPPEARIVQDIENRTSGLNLNNITRTKAYLDFHVKFPEIHWAFLAHMVSRNGGWNMTDLKGGLVGRLLTKNEAEAFFTFLERCNWLIFQDAFPQLLLYEGSRKHGRKLFHLLPHLGVSAFMEAVWNYFWEERDSYTITMGLVVNEQNYLESRVLDNPAFKENVFTSLEFLLQDVLSMNHILFPYSPGGRTELAGLTVHQFEDLEERILIGGKLYKILFKDEERLKRVKEWALANPHTGSRKDYWPNLFNDVEEFMPGSELKPRILACQLVPRAPRIFSPRLQYAWPNQKHPPAEPGDWFTDSDAVHHLLKTEEHIDDDIKTYYCKTLQQLDLAAIAKKAILSRSQPGGEHIITQHLEK
ncbi:DUF2515 domain-containing protein [Neobacillus piezotolerans]|uniref:DUF2515 domain-containing protein n=1 Tax=Neobacillus piezotolerans TaxID=2259171 RepID=UPI001FEA6262|nr:DUF2515 domain-containing protein [Neobacillus piezotolerans]